MRERSGSGDYELCKAGDAVQQTDYAWHRGFVEPPLSRTFPHYHSPELLSYAYSGLPRYCNQISLGQGPSNQTEFASQNGFMQTSISTTPYDWNCGPLNFPDLSVMGSEIWPGTGPADYLDDKQVSLQGMESFNQLPTANSPRAMLNMVRDIPSTQTATASASEWDRQLIPLSCFESFVYEISPSLQLQNPASLAIDRSPWALVNLPTPRTDMSTAGVDESCLYAYSGATTNFCYEGSAVTSQLAVPNRGMTASSSSWNCLTPHSRSPVDVNSDEYQEVPLPTAMSRATIQLGTLDDPGGDLLGLKSNQPRRPPLDELVHQNSRKLKTTQKKVKIALMPASSRPQSLFAKSTKGRRKSPLSEEGRRNAAAVRKIGGQCIRCRHYKAKCDPGNPCQECNKKLDNAIMFRQPCYRDNLKDARFVRHGNSRFGQEIVQHLKYRWTSNHDSPRIVEVRWALPGNEFQVELPILKLSCREYVPWPHKDTQTVQWQVNGKEFSITLPPFAVLDQVNLCRDVGNFLSQSEARIEQYIRQSHVDEVSRRTFEEACRYRDTHNSDLVRLALRIRCGSVMCQGFGTLIGSEAFGIKPINFYDQSGKCPYDKFNTCSDCPVPEAVEHQIDVEILGWLQKFQHELSGKINKILFPPGKKAKRLPWYEIFLTCYIMISNLEFIHGGALAYMESQRKTQRESEVNTIIKNMVAQFEHAAHCLLAHFRVVLIGFVPFEIARRNISELVEREELDPPVVAYIQDVTRIIEENWVTTFKSKEQGPADGCPSTMNGRWVRQLFKEQWS